MDVIKARKETGLSSRQFAQSIGINETQIRRWANSEAKLLASNEKARKIQTKDVKSRGRQAKIEEIVFQWLKSELNQGHSPNKSTIKSKAMEIRGEFLEKSEDHKRDLLEKFSASPKWFVGFCKRFDIVNDDLNNDDNIVYDPVSSDTELDENGNEM